MNGKQKRQGSKLKILLAVLVGLLVIAIAALAFFLVRGKMADNSYMESIQSAEKSLAANDYDAAIAQYRKAISIKPKAEEAYLALAEIYEDQGDISAAKTVLRNGYLMTRAARFQRLLLRLEELYLQSIASSEKKEPEEVIDIASASKNIGWDTAFVQKICSYNFEDFKENFGSVVSAQEDSSGYLQVVHSRLDAVCYYKNTAENKEIVDETRKTPLETAMPEKIVLNNINLLFRNFEGGVSLERFQLLAGEKLKPKADSERTLIEADIDICEIRIETDKEGNIISSKPWNEIILPYANILRSDTGVLSGTVIDAVSGQGVPNAKLTFKPADRSLKTKTVSTGQAGEFSIELEPDTYIITISANDYVEEEFKFVVERGKNYFGEQFVLSPTLNGSARIVLEWNAEPVDLDSYLFGTTDSGVPLRVFYGDKECEDDGKTVAALDLDDTNGYGPETITIYDLNGVYNFVVADYRLTGTLQTFGATVKVYLPGKQPQTITIDPNAGVENAWEVCVIDHGELRIINEASRRGSTEGYK